MADTTTPGYYKVQNSPTSASFYKYDVTDPSSLQNLMQKYGSQSQDPTKTYEQNGGQPLAQANMQTSSSQSPDTTVYDPTNDIKALGAAQKAAAIAGLGAAHDKSLSDLAAANAKIEPAYYDQRNSTSTDNQIAAKNFAEYAASKGENNATGMNGSMAQNNIASNLSLQGNLGSLAKGEAGAYADNAKQVADVNTAYNNDIASTSAGIDATNMQSIISAQQAYNAAKLAQANTDRGYNYQVGRDTVGDTGKLADGTTTLAGQQSQAAIKGQTLQNDYQALLNQNYPAEQALKMAQAKASLTGTNLANDYQTLQNAGYPAQQAAQLAQLAAQTASSNASTAGQLIQNQYMPQQLQAGINAQNASAAASNRSGYSSGGSSSSSSKAAATSNANAIGARFMEEYQQGTAGDWLAQNSDEIINNIGLSQYNAMLKQVKDDAAGQTALQIKGKNNNTLPSDSTSRVGTGGGGRLLAPS